MKVFLFIGLTIFFIFFLPAFFIILCLNWYLNHIIQIQNNHSEKLSAIIANGGHSEGIDIEKQREEITILIKKINLARKLTNVIEELVIAIMFLFLYFLAGTLSYGLIYNILSCKTHFKNNIIVYISFTVMMIICQNIYNLFKSIVIKPVLYIHMKVNESSIDDYLEGMEFFYSRFKKYDEIIKPKLITYILSVCLLILSFLEKYNGSNIINIALWRDISPIVSDSVVTLLAIERLTKYVNEARDKN